VLPFQFDRAFTIVRIVTVNQELAGRPVLNKVTLAYIGSDLVHVDHEYVCVSRRQCCAKEQPDKSLVHEAESLFRLRSVRKSTVLALLEFSRAVLKR